MTQAAFPSHLGTINIINNPDFQDSGRIVSNDGNFPALSFFDKHVLVQVLDLNNQVVDEFFNPDDIRVSANVSEWPPVGAIYETFG